VLILKVYLKERWIYSLFVKT